MEEKMTWKKNKILSLMSQRSMDDLLDKYFHPYCAKYFRTFYIF